MTAFREQDWTISQSEMAVILFRHQAQNGEIRRYSNIKTFLESHIHLIRHGKITDSKIAQIRVLLGKMRGEDWR